MNCTTSFLYNRESWWNVKKDSFIFYRSFYDAIKELPSEMQTKLYNTIFAYQFEEKEEKLSGIEKAVFTLIKPQLNANNTRYENGCKGAEFGKLGGRPKKEKPLKNSTGVIEENPNVTPNENDNENVNENNNENVNVVESDSRADGSQQFDSCVDGIVKFYEENIGIITPYVFEILNSYRTDFSDDVIIYALKLQVEAKALNINYAKAILNSWKKKNIKTLLDAKRENEEKKLEVKKDEKIKNIYQAENEQYQDLSKFYSN